MSKKEKKNKEENVEKLMETPVEATESLENNEQVETEIEALQRKLEEAEAKAVDNMDGWQRSQAEFVNYKNRVQRDRDLSYVSMKGDIIKKVLPVLDDLELALTNRPEGDSWADGMELIARKFQKVLNAEGLTRIEAAGQPFDPVFHEAVSSEQNEEFESDHVIEVIQNGYMLGERVIRPALVRVSE